MFQALPSPTNQAYRPTQLAWWFALPNNPIYQREKGDWGQSNPYYKKFTQYSPFVIIIAILLGLCAGYTNPAILNAGNGLGLIWCLLCLPTMIQTMIAWVGSIMAGIVTAPSICLERTNGTWEILCLIPQSPEAILLAKLFGGLARLRLIWIFLLIIGLIQAIVLICGGLSLNQFGAGMAGTMVTLLRPWQDILFTAISGMYLSTWTKSATIALAGTFGSLLVMKALSSLFLIFAISTSTAEWMLYVPLFGPVLIYGLAIVILLALLPGRAAKVLNLS